MPQASQQLRSLMHRWFGNEVDDTGPTAFLLSHGYTEAETGKMVLPVQAHSPSREEWACLEFLVDEWDWDYPDMEGSYW